VEGEDGTEGIIQENHRIEIDGPAGLRMAPHQDILIRVLWVCVRLVTSCAALLLRALPAPPILFHDKSDQVFLPFSPIIPSSSRSQYLLASVFHNIEITLFGPLTFTHVDTDRPLSARQFSTNPSIAFLPPTYGINCL